ncbi:MAG TPA: hypothetical protein P5160_01280 [Candidatus Omnitrophota bacterium]|nr:hypothetical protein [Candidatus Omnitrophota bacterium]
MRESAIGKNIVLTLVAIMMIVLNGCVYLVVGGVGALGGYVVSPDTVEGVLNDYDMDQVWGASKDVVTMMGVIMEESEGVGIMIAQLQNTRVTITVSRMGYEGSKLTVKARRSVFPRIKIAQDVYMKVVSRLEAGR